MNVQKKLKDHKLWVETHGEEGVQANLRGANLRGANLSSANLRGANLSSTNLCDADLYRADLYCADLYCADLRGADLRDTNLRGADLFKANLEGANLWGARGILQWQAPQGEKRICYSVKHQECVMHQLGCFWGTSDEAVEAIRKKYGNGSLYEEVLTLMTKCLESK